MEEKIIKDIMLENQKLRNEIIMLKSIINSLKMQLSEVKSDLITHKANERGRP